MNPITIPLSTPIDDDGRQVAEIQLRQIRLGDMIAIEDVAGRLAQSRAAIARLSGLSAKAIDQLTAEDFEAVMSKGAAHLGNAPAPAAAGAPSRG